MKSKGPLSIGEVAREAGLATSAIRYYERKGLLPAAARRSGQRVFDSSILDRLAVIGFAKAAGFTIAEIKKLLSGFTRKTTPGPRCRSLADQKILELDRRIEEAQRMKTVLQIATGCECPTFADCARSIRE